MPTVTFQSSAEYCGRVMWELRLPLPERPRRVEVTDRDATNTEQGNRTPNDATGIPADAKRR